MNQSIFARLFRRRADAEGFLRGGVDDPALRARVSFYQCSEGVAVIVAASGLPTCGEEEEYVFELFDGGCGLLSGNGDDQRMELPPLFSATDTLDAAFVTARFHVDAVIDRAIVLHRVLRDGDSKRMGCGLVKRN